LEYWGVEGMEYWSGGVLIYGKNWFMKRRGMERTPLSFLSHYSNTPAASR
jgi:hypothetical protein